MIRRTANNSVAITAALAVFFASTALAQVYTSMTFFFPVALAIIVAFGLGWLGRQLDVPAGLAPAVSFVGFVEYLTVTYFHKQALLGVVPTPEVFRAAGRLIKEAVSDINSLAAPVVQTRALVFITVAGVFAVAVVVDLIALSLRRPVLAGLPLLALFVIPSSLSPRGAGWFAFLLASVGYLALLTTEGRERVHRWGRRLVSRRLGPDDGYRAPILRAARGIGAAAIGLALIVPGLTPGLKNGLLTNTGDGIGTGSGQGRGTGRTRLSAVVNLRNNLRQSAEQELMRVRTDEPQYLRQQVLPEFTGVEWKEGKPSPLAKPDAMKPMPAPPGLTATIPTHTVTSRISVSSNFEGAFLPAPYSPVNLSGLKGSWRFDPASRVISSSNKSVRNSDYTVDSLVVAPDPQQLDDSLPYPTDITPYTKLKEGVVDPTVIQEALFVTREATTKWGRVVAIQNYFTTTGGFTYSTRRAPVGNGSDALRAFLLNRVGYCEQYAAAMAVMVRAIGLPSRVVIGFTPGTRKGDYYSITNKDAHAWPEVYFPSVGWVRFEPTPSNADAPSVATPEAALIVPTADPSPSASPSATSSGGLDGPLLQRRREDFDQTRKSGAPLPGNFNETSKTSRRPLLIGVLAFLLLLIPVVPAASRSMLRRRGRRSATTPRQRSHVAWRHLHDDARDVGLGWPQSASPRVAARTLIASAHLSGPAEKAVRRLSIAEENARYAPDSYLPASPPDFDTDVSVVRAALLAAVPMRQRLRAMVFPSRTLAEISRSVHLTTTAVGGFVGRLGKLVPASLRMRSAG